MKGQRDHLEDLLAELNKVALFTQAGRDSFLRDERDQYAVMMAYSRIGEILKQIDEVDGHAERTVRGVGAVGSCHQRKSAAARL